MAKCRSFYVQDKTFEYTWLVVCGGSFHSSLREYAKWTGDTLKKVKKDDFRDAAFAYTNGSKSCLMWFRKRKPHRKIVVHECVHAALYALRLLDIPSIGRENEEILAYYLGWLTKRVMK